MPKEFRYLELMHGLLERASPRELEYFFRKSSHRDEISDVQRGEILEFLRSSITRPKWRPFLRWVTDGRADHVDNLFQMFNRGRVPGNSHRFLAFLARLQGWKLILTTNFDDLIERAMRSEGMEPTVFDVWRAAELPNELLVGGRLSVIKLHGSAYGLQVGETLDEPLSEPEKRKLLGYLPENPLLLVLGYGGQDRRIMDFIAAVLERGKASRGPQVAWVHFEPMRPGTVEVLAEKYNSPDDKMGKVATPLVTARTFDSGAFLVGIHARLTSSQPTSAESYTSHTQRPLGLVASSIFDMNGSATAHVAPWAGSPPSSPVHVFTGESSEEGRRDDASTPVDAAAIVMSEFLSKHAGSHVPIWLDAGMFQSIEELVSEVMHQCRRHDPSLPSVALSLTGSIGSDVHKESLRRAAGRIHATLRRGSYILAIDEVGAFGRPPTTHHGLPSTLAAHLKDRMIEFCQFLTVLVENAPDCKDSHICLGINELADRFSLSDRTEITEHRKTFDAISGALRNFRGELERISGDGLVEFHRAPSRRRPLDAVTQADLDVTESQLKARVGDKRLGDLMMLVSTFRRPRSLVALRRLAIDYFSHDGEAHEVVPTPRLYEELDTWLGWLQRRQELFCLGGELYWMGTHSRDQIYERGSSLATGKQYLDAVEAPKEAYRFLGHAYDPQPLNDRNQLREIVRQLARLVYQHKQIARYYYSDMYLASKDIAAYSEYLYHRISSIRYETALAALLMRRRREFTDPGEAPGRSDPVACFEHRRLGPRGLRLALQDRLDDVRALERTLERDRDMLLSHVSSDTLLGWIKWIVPNDLPRFLIVYYGVHAEPGSAESRLEEQITDEIRRMDLLLRDLHGKVLREKTDYEGCIGVRIAQVRSLVSQQASSSHDSDPSNLRDDLGPGLAERLVSELLDPARTLLGNRSSRGMLRLGFEAMATLLDIAVCLRGLGRLDEAGWLIARLREVVATIRTQADCNPELDDFCEAMEVKLHFRAAELILTPIGLWDIKNDDVLAHDKLKANCIRAFEECDRGLALIRETNTEPGDYFVYRSYLRTLRGRALSLRGRFVAAFRDFDRALAGLDPIAGSGRGAMAICTLSKAESLMFYADWKIISNCTRSLGKNFDSSWLAPQGRLLLGFDFIVAALDPGFAADPTQVSARQLLRRAMTPWADHLTVDPEGFLVRVREAIRVIGAITPTTAANLARAEEALGTDPDRLVSAWRQIPEPDRNAVKIALRRSLAYWDTGRLMECVGKEPEVGEIDRAAIRSLERARDSLAQSETLLTGGRRDTQFWFLLHRLRAQAHFGELLMALTIGPAAPTCVLDRQRFHARFIDQACSGLRALRDARDNLLARPNCPTTTDRRIVALNRLQFQILLACACNAWIRVAKAEPTEPHKEGPNASVQPFWECFWRRWDWLTGMAGLERSDQMKGHESYLQIVRTSFKGTAEHTLATRAFMERHIKLFAEPLVSVRELRNGA
ncbi:SIR2 family protein [Singulisphaera sp. Ch08]|uniref:SIR2 family protein n=1 Tax=Singulisphaera sp. Ch08 TaxID=3120278 RepID=A0AAU7CJM0_9BACT